MYSAKNNSGAVHCTTCMACTGNIKETMMNLGYRHTLSSTSICHNIGPRPMFTNSEYTFYTESRGLYYAF